MVRFLRSVASDYSESLAGDLELGAPDTLGQRIRVVAFVARRIWLGIHFTGGE